MNISPQRISKYELRELLGRGGMGDVWKAFDLQLQRYVAFKLIRADLRDAEFIERFRREALAVASLHHPNIIQLYEAYFPLLSALHRAEPVIEQFPNAYMVMEYIEGQTLADYIDHTSHVKNFPSGEDIVRLFIPISSAIDYAHKQGLLHRDIKPANILLDKHNTVQNAMGEPILTDFGVVKSRGSVTGMLTRESLGTPHYISPEQAEGHSGTECSDIYSLGVILYEIFTGVTPFQGNNAFDIMRQHVTTLPTPPSLINHNIPPALNDVILCCLMKDPGARFPSASAMTTALAAALNISITRILAPQANEPLHPDLQSQSQVLTFRRSVISPSPVLSASPLPLSPPAPFAPKPRRKPRRLRLALIITLLIVLLGSGLGSIVAFHPWSVGTAAFQGQAFFLSSGLSSGYIDNQGINDEMEVDLQNVPAPDSSKSYYAWLLSIKEASTPILLGKLPFNNGQVHFLYPDPLHRNLLELSSRFLITEENTQGIPANPSPNAWHYYAAFSTKPDTTAQPPLSGYDHLQHLLAVDPNLEGLAPPHFGGLAIWFRDSTEHLYELSYNIGRYWYGPNTPPNEVGLIRDQDVHILGVLDGIAAVQQDLPPGSHADLRDAYIASVPLLSTQPVGQGRPTAQTDYLHHIIFHLNSLIQAPDATPSQRDLTTRIENALHTLMGWLEQIRTDAKNMVNMIDQNQEQQPSFLSTLKDLETQANYAFFGQSDQFTNTVQQEGAMQIYLDIQRLATFTLRACSSATSCSVSPQ